MGASQGPVVPPPSLLPRSISVNSDPAEVKWNELQLLTPTAPTLRASTFSKDAEPATRAPTTEVPVPSTRSSLKCTLVIVYWSFTGKSLTSMRVPRRQWVGGLKLASLASLKDPPCLHSAGCSITPNPPGVRFRLE